MKKIKTILYVSFIIIFFYLSNLISHASGVIVTPDTFGSNSNLTRIEIGYDVTTIEDGSFSNLNNLDYITVDSNNPYYSSYDGCLYNKDYTKLLCIPRNRTSVTVLHSVKSYSPHALDGISKERKERLDYLISNNFNELPTVTNNNSSVSVGSSSSSNSSSEQNNTSYVNNSTTSTQSQNGFWFNGEEYYENGESHYDCAILRDRTFEEIIEIASSINSDPDFIEDGLRMFGWSKVGE